MNSLGQHLKQLRTELKKSQEEVAREVGMTQGMISSFEKNKGDPTLSSLKRLAAFYGVSVASLLQADTPIAIQFSNIDSKKLAAITAILSLDGPALDTILDALKPLTNGGIQKHKARPT